MSRTIQNRALLPVCEIFTHGKKVLMNQGLCYPSMSLLTILSTEYGEKCGQLFRRAAPARCAFFTHGKIIHMNQRLKGLQAALLTILSTESVQNRG